MNFMQHASIKRAKSFYQSHAETSFNETKSEIEAGLDQLGSLEFKKSSIFTPILNSIYFR